MFMSASLWGALFGGVYEAKGRSTGKDFAIKVPKTVQHRQM